MGLFVKRLIQRMTCRIVSSSQYNKKREKPPVGIPVESWLSALIHVTNSSCQLKRRMPAKFIFVVFALVMLALVGFRFSR